MSEQGFLYEIFDSIQGEGLYCGQRQTFLRFAGCNLECGYCDTPAARDPHPKSCLVAGSEPVSNPLNVQQVVDYCLRYGCKSVSLTGGEPLVQVHFLQALMVKLKESGFRTHLETNGTLYRDLANVVRWTDVVAMDMKLPSSTGSEIRWKEHSQFLTIASSTNVFVKTVVCKDTTEDEILQCCDIIAPIDRHISLIIQPITGRNTAPGELLMHLQKVAMARLTDVRVIPQCHNILGLK